MPLAQDPRLLNSLPDLFIVVGLSGLYHGYFGGNDETKYQNLDALDGKSLGDFFDADLSVKVKSAIQRCVDYNVPVTVEYSLDVGGNTEWFSAVLSPVKDDVYDEKCALFSIQSITNEKLVMHRLYRSMFADPFFSLELGVINPLSVEDAVREFKNVNFGEIAECDVVLRNSEVIQSIVSKLKADVFSDTLARELHKNLSGESFILCSLGFGKMKVVAEMEQKDLKSLVSRVIENLSNSKISSDSGEISFPVELEIGNT